MQSIRINKRNSNRVYWPSGSTQPTAKRIPQEHSNLKLRTRSQRHPDPPEEAHHLKSTSRKLKQKLEAGKQRNYSTTSANESKPSRRQSQQLGNTTASKSTKSPLSSKTRTNTKAHSRNSITSTKNSRSSSTKATPTENSSPRNEP